jgi:tetratricopeptide (TPR) repeat protein
MIGLGACFASDSPDYAYVFENSRILSFEIEMSAEAHERMQPVRKEAPEFDPEKRSAGDLHGLQFNYVSATVRCNGEVYENVGVRYRGNASILMIPPDGKKPIKLDFDRFNKSQTFHGFKKLNFINCFRDPSRLRDKLTLDLTEKVGAPAPRASFASLYLILDGELLEHLGFFVVIEQVDDVFLQNRFGNSDGLLIKGEIVSDLEYRGDDWEAYAHDYELKSDKNSDTSLLIEFLKFVHQATDKQFAEEIAHRLNVERFLKFLAVNTLLVNLDSYAGLGHNWYLYFNTATQKFEHIPWDVNEAFGNLQLASPQQTLDFDIYRPYVADRILIRRLLKIEAYENQYLGYLREYVDGVFSPQVMRAEIDRLAAFIRDAVKADTHIIYSAADFEKSINETVTPKFPIFNQGVIGLKPFVAERVSSVKAQLAGMKQGHQIHHSPMGGPPPQAREQHSEETQGRENELKARLKIIDEQIKENPANADLYAEKGGAIGALVEIGGPMTAMQYLGEMREAFDKAIELNPEHIGGRMGRGMIRFHVPPGFGGDLDGAIADFEFIIGKIPFNKEVHLMLGMAYHRKGENEKAIVHFEKVLELDPENTQAKAQLEELRR